MIADSNAIQTNLRPGASVVLRRHPEGPVMVVLMGRTQGDARHRVVAWLDQAGRRCEQLFRAEELMDPGDRA